MVPAKSPHECPRHGSTPTVTGVFRFSRRRRIALTVELLSFAFKRLHQLPQELQSAVTVDHRRIARLVVQDRAALKLKRRADNAILVAT
jgi:hypothetical protein